MSSIPDGYEYIELKKAGHCIIRCTKTLVIDGEHVQCNHTIRNTKNPKPHLCYAKKTTPHVPDRGQDIKRTIAEFAK